MRDYYEILHVSRDAPTEIIQASYRTLMQKLKMHPDLGGNAELAARINTAYATLTDDSKRAIYDAHLLQSAGRSEAEEDASTHCVFCHQPQAFGSAPDPAARCHTCQSPLAPADQRRLEQHDKRAVSRIQKEQAVDLLTAPPSLTALQCYTEDMSLTGVRLVCDSRLDVGQIVRLRCRQLDAVARVANVRSRRRGLVVQYRVGLSFLTLCLVQPRGGFVSDRA